MGEMRKRRERGEREERSLLVYSVHCGHVIFALVTFQKKFRLD